jgi:hypothetical protein
MRYLDIDKAMVIGNYGESSWIFLGNNNLTRLDSNVFQTVLEKMRLYGRVPFAALRIDNSSSSRSTLSPAVRFGRRSTPGQRPGRSGCNR